MQYFLLSITVASLFFNYVFLKKYKAMKIDSITMRQAAGVALIVTSPYAIGLVTNTHWLAAYGSINILVMSILVSMVNTDQYMKNSEKPTSKKLDIANHLKDVNNTPYKFH